MTGDPLDPRASLSAVDRARLLNVAPAWLARCWLDLLTTLGLDEGVPT